MLMTLDFAVWAPLYEHSAKTKTAKKKGFTQAAYGKNVFGAR
jgi:hypothetical protein